MTIGVLAQQAGVGVETIRFYQRKRLLREPKRAFGRIRHYDGSDVARVRFVKIAQGLGFSLSEIAELLLLDDGAHCTAARGLAEQKLDDVREKLNDLQRIEHVLSQLVQRCRGSRGTVSCPLIDSLHAT